MLSTTNEKEVKKGTGKKRKTLSNDFTNPYQNALNLFSNQLKIRTNFVTMSDPIKFFIWMGKPILLLNFKQFHQKLHSNTLCVVDVNC